MNNTKYFLISIVFSVLFISCSNKEENEIIPSNVMTTSGHNFSPSLITCELGDTIFFELGSTHNLVEVSESDYNNNNSQLINNGYSLDYGESGFLVMNEVKTYYFVCTPHLPQMKSRIIVE
ncbi:MAG: hypothetical protein CMD38_00235 [Flavobacteriales bacterium]|nr:hypothetical protein [Flavobacteriales bacterium]|tara:strand:- start:5547 stop:5909 length:363 start_codon:yes stop_codon:yes gene_type:complete